MEVKVNFVGDDMENRPEHDGCDDVAGSCEDIILNVTPNG